MTTRRQFIKQTLGAVSVGVMLPSVFLHNVRAANALRDPNRRILIIIEFAGGNDGLNTVIPYSDTNYLRVRPTIGFRDTELRDAQGRSTMLSNELALHPSMGSLKELYDAGKVAVISGVGYPNPTQSHFMSADIWHTATLSGKGNGWLGNYAELNLLGKAGFPAVAIEDKLPHTLQSQKFVAPNIASFDNYGLQTDWAYGDNHDKIVNTFLRLRQRNFPAGSFIGEESRIGFDAVQKVIEFRESLSGYTTTVQYPNTSLAQAMQMIAQIVVSLPETDLLYVQMGGFDTHSEQLGQHANLLATFSNAVKAFYEDMAQHQLADNILLMQWSEFGRAVGENKSTGTDHGAASSIFVIGNKVRGGLYGRQPSLATTALDEDGNLRFNVDFRSVYATILDKWLNTDARAVLGATYENAGFLG